MKKFLRTAAVLSLAVFLMCSPGLAVAEAGLSSGGGSADSAAPTTLPSSSVIITEVLTGTKTSGVQEFVELYNLTDDPIDLTGWQLWYLSAQATDQNKPNASGTIKLGEGTDTPVIPAHGYFVLSGRGDYLPTVAQQFYGGTMAATGGNLRLLSPNVSNECLWDVQDQVGWGNALYPEGQAAVAPGTDKSIARSIGPDGLYVDTNNNASDFALSSTPSPGTANTQRATQAAAPIIALLPTVPIAGCTPASTDPAPAPGGTSPLEPPSASPPATVVDPNNPPASQGGSGPQTSPQPSFPPADVGLATPQLTEVMPNPAAPQTDATDEFIELYNSNDVAFDLSGFQLQVGLATKRHYTFPPGTSLAAKSFTSFFSADTGLSLSNSGGQVSLLDPFGTILGSSDPYGAAKDGQSWALAEGLWRWSTTPTPNAPNVVTLSLAATKKKPTTAASAKTPTSKTTTQKPKATTNTTSTPSSFAATTPSRQIHPGILAAIAGFAVLYGAYEYRKDVANKLYQFRANRTARRAARTEAEGG